MLSRHRTRLIVATLALFSSCLSERSEAFLWPNTIDQIETRVTQGDDLVRRKAAQRLGELPQAVARRLLPRVLRDPDVQVRLSAVDVALGLRLAGLGDLVLPWLNDADPRARRAAAEALRSSPSPRAVLPLGRVLGDPDPAVRASAAAGLGASKSPEAVMPLLAHLDDSDPRVRSAIVAALARLGDRRAVVPLIGKIQDNHPSVREAVARALGRLGDARAASALILALRDGEQHVRVAVIEALGHLGEHSAVPSLRALLHEESAAPVQRALLGALSRIASDECQAALIEALDAPTSIPRDAVIQALAAIGQRAVLRLESCLRAEHSGNRADGCALARGAIADEDAGRSISEALRRGSLSPVSALVALAKTREPANLPTVLEFLSDRDPSVRRTAIESASVLLDPADPDGRAVDPIVRAIESTRVHAVERVALVVLLGRTGAARAARPLARLADTDGDLELRVAALEALGMLGPSGSDRVLLSALSDESSAVRLTAAVALFRSASGSATRYLLDTLSEAKSSDRVVFGIALGGALSRSVNPEDATRTERLLARARLGERDVLIEALGRMNGAASRAALTRLARTSAEIADRAKVAEALANHPELLSDLRHLAKDPDASVRAHAVWSLGAVGKAADLGTLGRALDDRVVEVAGNAAAAIGRVGSRTNTPVASSLCAALRDERSYVRANLLSALRLVGARCESGIERLLVEEDRSEIARRAAAWLVKSVRSKDPDTDRSVLERCASEDASAIVGGACSAPAFELPEQTEPVSVYVVPAGQSTPEPMVPFALLRADGLLRLGTTDRRGSVFEARAPRGEVRLEVPAPLSF